MKSSINYNEKLNYKLLNNHLLFFTKIFGSFIVNVQTLKLIKPLLIYNYISLCFSVYHFCLTPALFSDLKYNKLKEFNYKETTYHRVIRVMFPIIVDVTALLSKITVYRMKIYLNTLYNYLYLSDMYINFNKALAVAVDSKVPMSEKKLPTNGCTEPGDEDMSLFKQHHSKVASYSCLVIILLILPANVMRLYELYINPTVSWEDVGFMAYMYWQNFYIATVELQFVIISYSIYLRFFEINIMLENISYNYNHKPMFDHLTKGDPKFHVTDEIVINNLDSTEYKIIEAIPLESINFEYIRISHLFLCEAYIVLNIIFKFQIIFSLGCCFSTSLLDLYYEFFGNELVPKTQIDIKVYCWIIQYFVRFVSIVIVAHRTTLESMKIKTFVASLNNQNLHRETQEELKLFLRQVESREMGFSAGGLFTLTTPLITSAVAAGITYLVVLIQFHNELVNVNPKK